MLEGQMTRLLGKNALITGASSGIGKAIAIRFAQEGANVAINYHSGADRAEAVRKEIQTVAAGVRTSGQDLTVQADVSDEAQVKRMFSQVIEKLGSLDILINN